MINKYKQFENYLGKQNFNGSSFYLKSNIINRFREFFAEELIKNKKKIIKLNIDEDLKKIPKKYRKDFKKGIREDISRRFKTLTFVEIKKIINKI